MEKSLEILKENDNFQVYTIFPRVFKYTVSDSEITEKHNQTWFIKVESGLQLVRPPIQFVKPTK